MSIAIQQVPLNTQIIYKSERYQYIENVGNSYHVIAALDSMGEFALANNDKVIIVTDELATQARYWLSQSDNEEMAARAMYYENNIHCDNAFTEEEIRSIINAYSH